MPKMRGIKPEIWTDEKFVELSPLARLLFVGMWHYACDNGHLDDKPKQLKMRVLPVDNVDPADLLDEMFALEMVTREQGGLTIPKLRDHQRLDNRYFTWCDRCALDEIPEPARSRHPGYTTGARSAHDGDTTGTRSAHTEARVKEGRKEGEGEGEGSTTGARRAKRAVQIPDTWEPTAAHKEQASELHLNLTTEADKFRDHARANGRTAKDWDAAFRNWLRKAAEYVGNVRALPGRPAPDEPAWMAARRPAGPLDYDA